VQVPSKSKTTCITLAELFMGNPELDFVFSRLARGPWTAEIEGIICHRQLVGGQIKRQESVQNKE
jgi:hypothetical protein